MRAQMAEIGLGAAVPKDPGLKSRLSKAVAAWQRDMGTTWGARKIKGSRDIAILKFSQNEDGRVSGEHVYTVGLSWASGSEPAAVLVPGLDEDGAALAALSARLEEAGKYMDSQEMSDVLSTCMAGNAKSGLLGAVQLRPSGGVYFVSGPKLPQLQDLRDLLAPMGARVCQYLIDAQGDNFGQVQGSVSVAIGDELTELRSQVTILGELESEADPRTEAALERRRIALKAKIELYRDVLGELTGQMLSELSEERAAKPPKMPADIFCVSGPEDNPDEAQARAFKAARGVPGAKVHRIGGAWFVDIQDHAIFGTGSFVFRPGEAHRFREGLLWGGDPAAVRQYAQG